MASKLFDDEPMEKLKAHPETAAILKDPEFLKVIEEIKANPNSLGTYLMTDPRISKLFAVMAEISAGERSASNGDVKTNVKGASSSENKPVEEDLSELPEEERKKKLALRAKDSGNVAYKKRDFETAIGKYSEAIELDPDNISFLTNRAAAKLESGDANGCIEDCKEAIKVNSDRGLRTDFKIIARAFGRMGNAYLKLGEFEPAIESFQKSLLEYHDPKIQRTLRETERAKERREAEAYINPDLSKQEREEGNALFKAGKFPESIKKYTESIKRNPKDAAPYSNRAAAYMKLGEFPMALKDCERCLEIDPNYVKAYIRKGNIHFFMKEYHKCLTDYEQGLNIDPNNRELRQGMMKTQMKIQEQQGSGQVDEARVKQAMQDPEIQAIMQDPQVNNALRQMESDQTFAAKAMRDPALSSKLRKLMAAGVLRVA